MNATSPTAGPTNAGPTNGGIAVLGLGRMGAAMAARLSEQGWTVTGWTRSGGRDLLATATGARYLLLALFDGSACAEVLDACAPALTAATTVLNTSTVGPDEAAELAALVRKHGAGYVHAPVLGSVGAVRGGTLGVLAGGEQAESAVPVLSALGDVLLVGTEAEAAALKLVAAGSLGQALLAIGTSRRHGRDLGLDDDRVLDVLGRGPMGALVGAKRNAPRQPAEFAVGALAKDLALLADRSPAAVALSRAVAAHAGDPEDDIVVVTGRGTAAEDVPAEVLEPLQAYIAGHATGDPAYLERAFLPTAHVEGVRDGRFVSWPLEEYLRLFDGRPATDEPTRERRIDSVEVSGTVATATMTLRHGADTFTDCFVLLLLDGRWRIANKVYRRH